MTRHGAGPAVYVVSSDGLLHFPGLPLPLTGIVSHRAPLRAPPVPDVSQPQALESSPDGMPLAVERLLTILESLNEQILASTKELDLQTFRASRQENRHRCDDQKARRNPVRDLAGWNHVHPGEIQHVGGQCFTSYRPCSNDQPMSRGGNRVSHVSQHRRSLRTARAQRPGSPANQGKRGWGLQRG